MKTTFKQRLLQFSRGLDMLAQGWHPRRFLRGFEINLEPVFDVRTGELLVALGAAETCSGYGGLRPAFKEGEGYFLCVDGSFFRPRELKVTEELKRIAVQLMAHQATLPLPSIEIIQACDPDFRRLASLGTEIPCVPDLPFTERC